MKKHKVTLIETSNLNDIKEGDIYIKIDSNTGLIKEMAKRKNGKMISILCLEPEVKIEPIQLVKETKQEIKEVKEVKVSTKTSKKAIKEVPASEDTLSVKPLKIE